MAPERKRTTARRLVNEGATKAHMVVDGARPRGCAVWRARSTSGAAGRAANLRRTQRDDGSLVGRAGRRDADNDAVLER